MRFTTSPASATVANSGPSMACGARKRRMASKMIQAESAASTMPLTSAARISSRRVPESALAVGRTLRHAGRDQGQRERSDVGQHVSRVGHQREGSAEPSADRLDHHENGGEDEHLAEAGLRRGSGRRQRRQGGKRRRRATRPACIHRLVVLSIHGPFLPPCRLAALPPSPLPHAQPAAPPRRARSRMVHPRPAAQRCTE